MDMETLGAIDALVITSLDRLQEAHASAVALMGRERVPATALLRIRS
jgi:hypothetical protein